MDLTFHYIWLSPPQKRYNHKTPSEKEGTHIKKAYAPIIILALTIGLSHFIHALTLDRSVEFRQVSVYSPRWPEGLEGYRIAFISDTHGMAESRLQRIINELNQWEPDLLLLGGDHTRHRGSYRRTMGALSQIAAGDGIFGVEGNHDNHVRLFGAMRDYGIMPLSNSGLQIRDGFYLAGVEDLWSRQPCVATAIAGAGETHDEKKAIGE